MKIVYDAKNKNLSYAVDILFPKVLDADERIAVEGVARYWGNIPYVTYEGIYGTKWFEYSDLKQSKIRISVDFTKSASDDIGYREVLEKLADWVENGTPVRKDKTQKELGVGIQPIAVKTSF